MGRGMKEEKRGGKGGMGEKKRREGDEQRGSEGKGESAILGFGWLQL